MFYKKELWLIILNNILKYRKFYYNIIDAWYY